MYRLKHYSITPLLLGRSHHSPPHPCHQTASTSPSPLILQEGLPPIDGLEQCTPAAEFAGQAPAPRRRGAGHDLVSWSSCGIGGLGRGRRTTGSRKTRDSPSLRHVTVPPSGATGDRKESAAGWLFTSHHSPPSNTNKARLQDDRPILQHNTTALLPLPSFRLTASHVVNLPHDPQGHPHSRPAAVWAPLLTPPALPPPATTAPFSPPAEPRGT